MAIAYDAGSSDALATSPNTWAHTCAAGASLVVGVNHTGTSSAVTYNGTALTKQGDDLSVANAYNIGMWFLQSASSGTNNIVVTASTNVGGAGLSYTGVSGGVDSTAQGQTGATPIEMNLPSITATGCWIAAIHTDDGSNPSASTGYTMRKQWSGGTGAGDSNGTVGTGSQTIYATYTSGSSKSGYVAVALSPTVSASGPAKLKTWNTIQKSAIKTIDSVALASIKSVDTIT